ncbi:MAG TPA: amidohydrolase family protein [Gammaproteobacteria bacterium]|nr:amidohydrolase family protein [Gammaproteobacteria bacterium]
MTVSVGAGTGPTRPDHRFSDAHLHFVDYFQESEGMDALFEAMDEARVDHAMLSGMAVKKKWAASEPQKPEYVFGDDAGVYWYGLTDVIVARAVSELPAARRARLHPFISGFNPTDKNAVEHVRRMLEWYPGLWQGIGEVITRHDDLTALIDGEPPRASHAALDPVYTLAAEHALPVLVHSNITSVRIRKPLYLEELESALAKHPRTRFIWAHAGTSAEVNRRIDLKFLDKEVERLLGAYPNLWIDLSWSVLDDYLLDGDEDVNRHWIEIIERHPERFMLGSDLLGRFGNMPKKFRAYRALLDALSPECARLVARDNFLSILPDPSRGPDEMHAAE